MDATADVLRLINGFRASQAVHVAAVLGLSDRLADGPRATVELGAELGCDAPSLYRLLRALSTVGMYEELPDGRFASTPLGDELRTGRPLRSWAAFVGRPAVWRAWSALEHSVRTGENAFTSVHGEDVWAYRARHPDEGLAFDAAMTGLSRWGADAMLDAYDFGRYKVVADIGGGHGAVLAAILARHPGVRGILFDQPHVVAGAPALLAEAGVADRCEVVAGDMFEAVPPGADAYALKSILHDWRDDEAVAILRTCRRAMTPDAAVLILERVLPGPPHGPESAASAFADLNMLVGPGGQERTRDEYAALLDRAGLRLVGVTSTPSDVSIVEAGT